MKKSLRKFVPLVLMFVLLTYGCAQNKTDQQLVTNPTTTDQKQKENVYKGKIVGKSNKAKTISISVGKGDKAKTMMVRFDDKTKGIEHASKGHAAIIAYENRNGDPWATVVKPKLAKLPEGVTEIKTAELYDMIEKNTDFMLIDARPVKRYVEAHMPGAVSLSVPDYKKNAPSVLPSDKDKLLVFYCGGPT